MTHVTLRGETVLSSRRGKLLQALLQTQLSHTIYHVIVLPLFKALESMKWQDLLEDLCHKRPVRRLKRTIKNFVWGKRGVRRFGNCMDQAAQVCSMSGRAFEMIGLGSDAAAITRAGLPFLVADGFGFVGPQPSIRAKLL